MVAESGLVDTRSRESGTIQCVKCLGKLYGSVFVFTIENNKQNGIFRTEPEQPLINIHPHLL